MDTPTKTVLTLQLVRELLAPPSHLEGKCPTTISPGDTAKVLIRFTDTGKLIQALDPDEEYYHIEFCKDDGSRYHWAEIWPSREWRESNTRRNAVKERSAVERTEWDKKNSRISKLKEALTRKGLAQKPGFVEHLAESMYSCWKAEKYNELFKVLEMGEMLAEFQEEDKSGQK